MGITFSILKTNQALRVPGRVVKRFLLFLKRNKCPKTIQKHVIEFVNLIVHTGNFVADKIIFVVEVLAHHPEKLYLQI